MEKPVKDCEHFNFFTKATVARVTNQQGEIQNFVLEVQVICSDCGNHFAFKGMEGGLSYSSPRVGAFALEARLPIEPTKYHKDEGLH